MEIDLLGAGRRGNYFALPYTHRHSLSVFRPALLHRRCIHITISAHSKRLAHRLAVISVYEPRAMVHVSPRLLLFHTILCLALVAWPTVAAAPIGGQSRQKPPYELSATTLGSPNRNFSRIRVRAPSIQRRDGPRRLPSANNGSSKEDKETQGQEHIPEGAATLATAAAAAADEQTGPDPYAEEKRRHDLPTWLGNSYTNGIVLTVGMEQEKALSRVQRRRAGRAGGAAGHRLGSFA